MGLKVEPSTLIVRAVSLTKTYGDGEVEVPALKSANIEVCEGDFVAIMGPSGSGKSTLLHLLGGLDYATSGQIFIRDVELTGLSDKQLTLTRRSNIGFVFQFYNLLPTLTAEENILVPIAIGAKASGDVDRKLSELFSLIGLEGRRRHRPDQLSGGEQQRVAIARALITDPAIILADEPTGNLDRRHGREILELLKRSATEMGQTIIMVTHDPAAAAYADRAIFLRDGVVVKELRLGGEDDTEAIITGLKELGD